LKKSNFAKKASSEDGKNMEWTKEAENKIKKVPFFVRKKVRLRIEEQVAESGKKTVYVDDVNAVRKRFVEKMDSEIKGYQIDTCFGHQGCPNRANTGDRLLKEIESILKKANLLSFLKQNVGKDLKFHHEFRVTISECPNACSQPQIKDIGIIGAIIPVITGKECTFCRLCVQECIDNCIEFKEDKNRPAIDFKRCAKCGKCTAVCPTGTVAVEEKGFRIQLAGKLGRHPRLAQELPGFYTENEVINIVQDCIAFYKQNSKHGQRFSEIFTQSDFNKMAAKAQRHKK